MSWKRRTSRRLVSGFISSSSPKQRIINAVFIQGKRRGVWSSESEERVKKYLDRRFTRAQLWVALEAVNRGRTHDAFTGWTEPAKRKRATARGLQLLLMI